MHTVGSAMRNFFIGLLIMSLLAVGGAYYWRVYYPESRQELVVTATRKVEIENGDQNRSYMKAAPEEQKAPSERQDWAMIISVASSIISALGAAAQVWLTHRGLRA